MLLQKHHVKFPLRGKGAFPPLTFVLHEVQSAPFLLDEAKVILDEVKDKGNYIFSGSQKWQLMKELGESLVGTASILEMTMFIRIQA